LVALAALNLLGDLASDRPIALLVDDARWLDAPTSEVLHFLAPRVAADPILLLVISCREGFRGPLAVPEAQEIDLRLELASRKRIGDDSTTSRTPRRPRRHAPP
jgi:hypothetical protein